MSHLADIDITITEKGLKDLERTARELGAEFRWGQKTYEWFGESMGDYPLPTGLTKADLGKCEHAIRLPGCHYEIGVVKRPNGTYTLLYDFWGKPTYINGQRLGRGEMLKEHFGGEGLAKLKQHYGLNHAASLARAKGFTTQRKKTETGIKLVVTGNL